MKLLLTSNGLCNQSIANALLALVGKPAAETVVTFIPTSMNPAEGGKDWFINDLWNIKKQGFKQVDIVDISALPPEEWRPRIEAADVLFFGGGDTYHLMYWFRRSGLRKWLPELLKTRVYAGISAGSIATGPDLALTETEPPFKYDNLEYLGVDGLNFVDFYFRPHFGNPSFAKSQESYLRDFATQTTKTIYALDDNSALKVVNGAVEVVSEGKWMVLNDR
jgi:dipeptidase E